ncbi:MAG: hypothetical protein LUE12_08465 [Ruminococcus sp.]|nr:hypothetical protein [Ruminococcus sp.]
MLTLVLGDCSSASGDDLNEYVDLVEVSDTDSIETIPEESETELERLCVF